MEHNEIITARVTAVHRERYQLLCEKGECYGRLKTKEYHLDQAEFPAAGDYVTVQYIGNGDSLILATQPRRTVFTRRAPGPVPRAQAVAVMGE